MKCVVFAVNYIVFVAIVVVVLDVVVVNAVTMARNSHFGNVFMWNVLQFIITLEQLEQPCNMQTYLCYIKQSNTESGCSSV